MPSQNKTEIMSHAPKFHAKIDRFFKDLRRLVLISIEKQHPSNKTVYFVLNTFKSMIYNLKLATKQLLTIFLYPYNFSSVSSSLTSMVRSLLLI